MRLSNVKRIVKEDFAADDQAVAEKLGYVINAVFDQLAVGFNKGIDFDNLNQELLSFTVEVDADGVPKAKTSIKISLKTGIKGVICVRALAKKAGIYAESTPFVSFESNQTDSTILIKNIAGIPENQTFTLTVVVIG